MVCLVVFKMFHTNKIVKKKKKNENLILGLKVKLCLVRTRGSQVNTDCVKFQTVHINTW